MPTKTDAPTSEAVLVGDPRIDTEQFMLDGIDTSDRPHFTVSEVAKVFFARSAHWMRWRERSFFFMLGGDAACPHFEMKKQKVDVEQKDGTKKKVLKNVVFPWVNKTTGVCKKCKAKQVGSGRTDEGARSYTLSDIEKIAHALARRGAINGTQLRNTLSLVQVEARLWGYL